MVDLFLRRVARREVLRARSPLAPREEANVTHQQRRNCQNTVASSRGARGLRAPPDRGGDTFPDGIARRLIELGFNGQVFEIRMTGDQRPGRFASGASGRLSRRLRRNDRQGRPQGTACRACRQAAPLASKSCVKGRGPDREMGEMLTQTVSISPTTPINPRRRVA
jgi:hypothetical protein